MSETMIYRISTAPRDMNKVLRGPDPFGRRMRNLLLVGLLPALLAAAPAPDYSARVANVLKATPLIDGHNDWAEALRARGIAEPAATLAAQSGATVFGIAFSQWIREGETRSLPDIASGVLQELVSLTGLATGSRK